MSQGLNMGLHICPETHTYPTTFRVCIRCKMLAPERRGEYVTFITQCIKSVI